MADGGPARSHRQCRDALLKQQHIAVHPGRCEEPARRSRELAAVDCPPDLLAAPPSGLHLGEAPRPRTEQVDEVSHTDERGGMGSHAATVPGFNSLPPAPSTGLASLA